ncbi:mRNA interferase MazF [Scopulibacillus darangshiensis]|uniref:mRNA interferase MazF n=1 Tax=Scopulibacillus darangshiensis TaxID=442528 RepID=A0A4R2NAN3_9BACL|nr:type II toxin-antitoxin system PemK/MazF family toxin [Scopulibacillus darangshiensis]TCP18035.1 mRNA interferase MazF [Scopulibacillus darangshiensis]
MSAPDRGDLVYLDFDPQSGHEQAGRRPGIVLSPKEFNAVTGFIAICPITNTTRGWGFEIALPSDLVFQGVILTDQVKSLDWSTRSLQVKGHAPEEVITECLDKIHTFL